MLEEIKKSYVEVANTIKNWEQLDKNTLANLYIKNEKDEYLRNAYFAALMCKYWNNIGKYYTDSKKSVDIEECYDWLVHAITYALKNRKWIDPSNKLYTDKSGPDKVINRCIASTRQIFYQSSNTAKRRLNYQSDSLDRQLDAFGDAADALEVCENSTKDSNSSVSSVIDLFIKRNNYLEAFILDGIAYQDSFKEHKTKTTSEFINEYNETDVEELYKFSYSFDEKKLVKHLKSLNDNYINYFETSYDADIFKIIQTIDKIKKTSNNNLYKYIRKTLYDLKYDKEVIDILC